MTDEHQGVCSLTAKEGDTVHTRCGRTVRLKGHPMPEVATGFDSRITCALCLALG